MKLLLVPHVIDAYLNDMEIYPKLDSFQNDEGNLSFCRMSSNGKEWLMLAFGVVHHDRGKRWRMLDTQKNERPIV